MLDIDVDKTTRSQTIPTWPDRPCKESGVFYPWRSLLDCPEAVRLDWSISLCHPTDSHLLAQVSYAGSDTVWMVLDKAHKG